MNFEKYDKLGRIIDTQEWVRLFTDHNYQIIKQETLSDGTFISTVWLGLDHSYKKGKPLIFETMVFSSRGTSDEIDTNRYSTLQEAEKGHKEMVEKYIKKSNNKKGRK